MAAPSQAAATKPHVGFTLHPSTVQISMVSMEDQPQTLNWHFSPKHDLLELLAGRTSSSSTAAVNVM